MKGEVEVGGPDPERLQGIPDGGRTPSPPQSHNGLGAPHTPCGLDGAAGSLGTCGLGHHEGDRQPALLKAGGSEHERLAQAALFTGPRAPEDWPQVSPLGLAGAAPPSSGR